MVQGSGQSLRFSRVEFAWISGLKFGPTMINPDMLNNKVSVDSVYAWLLESKPILHVDLRAKFVDKHFKVNKVEVKGSEGELLGALDPSESELNRITGSLKKKIQKQSLLPSSLMQITKKRNEDKDEEEVIPVVGASTSTANAQLLPLNILVGPDRKAMIKEIGYYAGEIAAKGTRIEVEALRRIHEERMIAAAGEYVVTWEAGSDGAYPGCRVPYPSEGSS
ncbi:hypothetical protein OROGR_023004 [Orobanche gracilis]